MMKHENPTPLARDELLQLCAVFGIMDSEQQQALEQLFAPVLRGEMSAVEHEAWLKAQYDQLV